jgi:hypothetical protein
MPPGPPPSSSNGRHASFWTKRCVILVVLIGIYLANLRFLALSLNDNDTNGSSTGSHSVVHPLVKMDPKLGPISTNTKIKRMEKQQKKIDNIGRSSTASSVSEAELLRKAAAEPTRTNPTDQQEVNRKEPPKQNRNGSMITLDKKDESPEKSLLPLFATIRDEPFKDNGNNVTKQYYAVRQESSDKIVQSRLAATSVIPNNAVSTNHATKTNNVLERSGTVLPPKRKQQAVNKKSLGSNDTIVRLNQHLRYDNVTLQIPTPVFLASLPKSGTTSVWKYFSCGGVKASHFYVKLNETEAQRFGPDVKDSTFAGRCLHANVLEGRPLLENCGPYQVWTDTGYIKGRPAIQCYYPAIEGLDEFVKWYPNATLLYITRQTDDWTQSVSRWSMGTLLRRWKRCNLMGLINTTYAGMNAFYEWHKRLVRNFAKAHPSLTYIEAALEDPETGFLLQDATGIPASCWADCNPQTRQCRTIK